MKFEKYPKYKDSGVEWLGEIPEHWELTRLGTRFEERRMKVSDKDFPALSVTKNGIVPQLESAAKTNDGDNRKLVMKGDFVINSRSDRKGSSGIAYQDGSVSLINTVMSPKGIDTLYCNYLLKGNAFVEEFYRVGHGIVADLWTTKYSDMKNIKIGIPTIEEQIAIANFLDKKCGKLDTAIKQKENLIKLLKEQKQIIIQNAVTKGIKSNRKMKDSGVEWIGEVPEEWRIEKLKTFTNFINRGSTPSYVEKSDVCVINQATFSKGFFDLSNIKYTKETIKTYNKNRGCVKKHDLLIASTGGGVLGKVAYFTLEEGHFIADSHVTIIRTNKNASNKFYYYLFSINYKLINGVLAQGSTNQTELQREWLRSFLLPLPIKKEQNEIVKYIEFQSFKIDKSIKLQEKQIEKLKEYKETLIDSVVTGKVKV